MVDTYFVKMTILDRIPMLTNPLLHINLIKAILKEENRVIKNEIVALSEMGGFNEEILEKLRNDPGVQESYKTLFDHAQFALSKKEKGDIRVAFTIMEPLLKAGFLDYYRNYWEKKLAGPTLLLGPGKLD